MSKRDKSEDPARNVRQDNSRFIILLFVLPAFTAGFFLAWYWRGTQIPASRIHGMREPPKDGRQYTNPLLLCDASDPKESSEYKPLEKKFNEFIAQNSVNGETVSVYFRELISGRWVSVNEDEQYSPASLTKVPLMMAYLKYAETHPEILKEVVFYDGSFDENKRETFKSDRYIKPGHTYSVNELLEAMIGASDNNAAFLLSKYLDPRFVKEVYTDLGIYPPNLPLTDFMTVKLYSYFFRILYNATYLNREYSEKSMQLLTLPDFPQGITAGIPKEATDIALVQKFGERTVADSDDRVLTKELHDCGIVYHPNNPYLLCVMTKSRDKDFGRLISLIQGISRTAYEWEKGSAGTN